MILPMAVTKQNEARDKESDATIGPFKVRGKVGVTGEVSIRLIQHSPATNPELLTKTRKIARELKKTRDAIVTHGKPSKAAASQKVKAKFASKKPKAVSYTKKSLSLFPVK
jgi:hypothetical protein